MGIGRMARLSERPRWYVKARLTGNAAAAGHRRWDSRCRDGAERAVASQPSVRL